MASPVSSFHRLDLKTNMASAQLLLLVPLLLLTSCVVMASDPSPLQDFCVADANSTGTLHIVFLILDFWLMGLVGV